MSRPPLLRRVLSKSPRTIAFRGSQAVVLGAMRSSGGWQKLSSRIARRLDDRTVARWMSGSTHSVLAADGAETLRMAVTSSALDAGRFIAAGDAVMRREIEIFGLPIPQNGPWPWHRDWRFGHEWSPAYFRNYRHTEPREQPYDVKFPWELSRLGFLPKLVQADVLQGGNARTAKAFAILREWYVDNPLAHSVNWYPMEAAMRGIQLCLLADMSRQAGLNDANARLMLQTLAEHGEFVMRTLELTDHAGNHYTAELVALLLIGRTLQTVYPRAQRWMQFAARRLGGELMRQFLPDGVNFEKSTAYHRLVLDLFLLAAVALERSGTPFNSEQRERLRAAARYNAAFMRPDRLCPLIGDSDDAVVFEFEQRAVRDHAAGLGLAALLCRDAELKAAAGSFQATCAWLFGGQALSIWNEMPEVESPFHGAHYFADGGVVIAKSARHYLFMDIGEVGQNGLGGHGHNDLLSFELFVDGQPLIVDPGSYLYSGDLKAHDRFRSAKAHNALVVDDAEIASFTGPFRISNQARPVDVQVSIDPNGSVMIDAGHSGYTRMVDPVSVRRKLGFDWHTGVLNIEDDVRAAGRHQITLALHLASGLDPKLDEGANRAQTGKAILAWSSVDRAWIDNDDISPYFGCLEASRTLVLERYTDGDARLSVSIRPVSEAARAPSQ